MTSIEDTKRNLPDGWRWVRLGEVIQEAQAGFACGLRDPQGIAQLRMNNLDTRGNFFWDDVLRVPHEANDIEQFLIVPGDVLFNNTNSTELVGKSALFEGYVEPIVYSNHFTRLRTVTESLLPGFLASWLNHKWQQGVFAAICNRWIGQSAVKADKLFNLDFPLPPLSEQRRIAGVLREQMAAVEQARTAAQARLEAVKTIPASLLRQVFNGPDAQAWPRMKFEQVSLLQRGYDLPEPERKPGPYPVVTSSGIVGTHCEFRARGPGVVTGRSGSVGRVHFIEEDFWPHNTALYIKDFMGNNPIYIFYLLQWVNVKTISSGTGVPTLDRKEVHKLMVSHPSLSEQERIVGILKKQMAAVEKARAASEEELQTINALPAALLRRAFNGEI
jgi:type I restriction enzyme S subunit